MGTVTIYRAGYEALPLVTPGFIMGTSASLFTLSAFSLATRLVVLNDTRTCTSHGSTLSIIK